MQINLIPRNRLKNIPADVRFAHEYCFFLHDSCVQMLIEYESANTHVVRVPFRDEKEKKRFQRVANSHDSIAALRAINREDAARKVILNHITYAMVSDCAHHICEALCCMEKRKFIPAFNLLRKPLLDTFTYLAWIASDEDDFYAAFSSGDPAQLSLKRLGNRRTEIFDRAITATNLRGVLSAESIVSSLYDAKNEYGLYGLFQHAVHLVTVERVEIRTSPENFNFIFKSPSEDDIYEGLYETLPEVLLLLSHVILYLFERIKPADSGAKQAFVARSTGGFRLLQSQENTGAVSKILSDAISGRLWCFNCKAPPKFTRHNAARILLSDTYRCPHCKSVSSFPFSWMP